VETEINDDNKTHHQRWRQEEPEGQQHPIKLFIYVPLNLVAMMVVLRSSRLLRAKNHFWKLSRPASQTSQWVNQHLVRREKETKMKVKNKMKQQQLRSRKVRHCNTKARSRADKNANTT